MTDDSRSSMMPSATIAKLARTISDSQSSSLPKLPLYKLLLNAGLSASDIRASFYKFVYNTLVIFFSNFTKYNSDDVLALTATDQFSGLISKRIFLGHVSNADLQAFDNMINSESGYTTLAQQGITVESILSDFSDCYYSVIRGFFNIPYASISFDYEQISKDIKTKLNNSDPKLLTETTVYLVESFKERLGFLENIVQNNLALKEFIFNGNTDSIVVGNIPTIQEATNVVPFDVFLSHNSQDKLAVEQLALRLAATGVNVWFDKWNLIPGEAWQEGIEAALDMCRVYAIFVGPAGIGPWENEEMRSALETRVYDKSRRVIPVLLPGSGQDAYSLPRFLRRMTLVNFEDDLNNNDSFRRLLAGIRGIPPGP